MAGNVRETSAYPQREIAKLQREVGQLRRDLAAAQSCQAEALEQQTATAEILRVISQSPSDTQPVMDSIVEHAARLADADHAFIGRAEGDEIRWLAAYGTPLAWEGAPISRALPSGRAMLDCQTTQVADIATLADQFPTVGRAYRELGVRTILATPLLREGAAIGVLLMRRLAVRPFTDQQIKLLETFADQAVIAIENTRLFHELRQRTADLSKALEQQTATSEVLQVISSSPGELEPVFQAMLENATRICEASFGNLLLYDGDVFRHVALHNAPPAWAAEQERDPIPPRDLARVLYRIVDTKQVAPLADTAAKNPDEPIATIAGARTLLIVPMLKDEELVGVIAVYRQEVRPFNDKQVELMRSFAAQAVIAIENTRLFTELQV